MPMTLLAVAVAMFFMGAAAALTQLRNLIPGEGVAARIDNAAWASAQVAELYGAMCTNTAISQPGVTSENIDVAMPTYVKVPSAAHSCVAQALPAGGRMIYAWMQTSPGAVGDVLEESGYSAVWHVVTGQGQARNLVTGDVLAVPVQIPVGALVDIVYTSK
uniref:hypothetical protein n=1 Tax=Burkholderia arboris TaxID=488730 RepID=UPI003BEF36F9